MKTIPESFRATDDLLRDRVILVTGATGGFGKTVSLALARHGATVILVARNLRLVESLYDEIEQAGYPTPAIYPMNLEGATEHDYLELANNIESQLGRLDGMIHCAATLGAPTVFAQSDSTTWYQVHQVNLHAPYLLTRACLPLLSRSEKSSILFMTDDKPGATGMLTRSANRGSWLWPVYWRANTRVVTCASIASIRVRPAPLCIFAPTLLPMLIISCRPRSITSILSCT